jgi:uncharacterized protein (DUF2141 family)
MKRIILLTAFILSFKGFSQNISLKVEITGYKSNKGMAYIAVYKSEQEFLKKPTIGKIVKIENNKAVVIFNDLPKGEYAISSYHDENGNGKLDTNFMGIPKEDYAVSNNAKGFMSAPKYKDAKFIAKESKTITMKI